MLVVTDKGVQVLLKQKSLPNIRLKHGLITVSLVVINCLLGLGLKSYSLVIFSGINLIILACSLGLQAYRKRYQPIILSGGDLLLTPNAFIHTHLGKSTQYQLTQNDKIETQGDSVRIRNGHNKLLYQINGFTEPKQLEVAQAILQGKQIKTQGKAIRMQG